MHKRMFCLMVAGFPLSDESCDKLLEVAAGMMRKGSERAKIKTDELEGLVQTKFKTTSLGYKTGYEFVAEVDTDRGKTTVKYLVSEADRDAAKDYVWGPWMTLDPPKSHPSNTAYLN